MEIALVFGGVVVSLLVNYLKKIFESSGISTIAIVVVISLLGGVAYTLMTQYGLWESFIGVLASAGAFYAFVIKSLDDSKEK